MFGTGRYPSWESESTTPISSRPARASATLFLREAEREPAVARRIGNASSPSAEAHLSKRARLMLPWELGRLADPIPEWWKGRPA